MHHDHAVARVALVTGASRDIGRATAIRLAHDFSTVAIVARSAEGLAGTADAIRAAGAQPFALPIDLRQSGAAGQAVLDTVSALGRLDAVAAIAGDVSQKGLFELNDQDWHDSLMLKFHAMRRLMIAAWPHLRQSGGAVVITSGTTAFAPKADFAAVGAINAMILSVARCFAEVGQADGVRVNTVSPGPVMTDRRRAMLARYALSHGLTEQEALDHFTRNNGISRFGRPEELAEVFAWLVSPAASWICGSNIRIDGGEVKMAL
ncbi:SDR family oxidoreductase [Novosphingobium sp. KACC 22771]|uniref:SDR family oxidoreductase n=1 Tax=Novosphingobium sp. KACC 22771 TaxID=3025670 RepID=UPI00236587D8|nr:SDR family oxidoreductase [Novosphingobium sp. KACC 22771]WDF70893.1 SDR family oxidoreductase [Novosphingobium sp. KACC 22771]